jgi:hypothetical protein
MYRCQDILAIDFVTLQECAVEINLYGMPMARFSEPQETFGQN